MSLQFIQFNPNARPKRVARPNDKSSQHTRVNKSSESELRDTETAKETQNSGRKDSLEELRGDLEASPRLNANFLADYQSESTFSSLGDIEESTRDGPLEPAYENVISVTSPTLLSSTEDTLREESIPIFNLNCPPRQSRDQDVGVDQNGSQLSALFLRPGGSPDPTPGNIDTIEHLEEDEAILCSSCLIEAPVDWEGKVVGEELVNGKKYYLVEWERQLVSEELVGKVMKGVWEARKQKELVKLPERQDSKKRPTAVEYPEKSKRRRGRPRKTESQQTDV